MTIDAKRTGTADQPHVSRRDELRQLLQHAHLYGFCHACGKDISSSRLRALPFAVRCRDCEALAETARARARTAQGRAAPHSGSRGTSDPPAHAGGR